MSEHEWCKEYRIYAKKMMEDKIKLMGKEPKWTGSLITIETTKEQFELLIEALESYHDRGPINEGWQSDKLQELINTINRSTSRIYDNGGTQDKIVDNALKELLTRDYHFKDNNIKNNGE